MLLAGIYYGFDIIQKGGCNLPLTSHSCVGELGYGKELCLFR